MMPDARSQTSHGEAPKVRSRVPDAKSLPLFRDSVGRAGDPAFSIQHPASGGRVVAP
jgi:hypothetical protein